MTSSLRLVNFWRFTNLYHGVWPSFVELAITAFPLRVKISVQHFWCFATGIKKSAEFQNIYDMSFVWSPKCNLSLQIRTNPFLSSWTAITVYHPDRFFRATRFSARTASRCRRVIFYRCVFSFFLSSFLSTHISEVTERISTELLLLLPRTRRSSNIAPRNWTNIHLWLLFEKFGPNSPEHLPPMGWGINAFWDRLSTLTEYISAIKHDINNWNETFQSTETPLQGPEIWWTLVQKRLRTVGENVEIRTTECRAG